MHGWRTSSRNTRVSREGADASRARCYPSITGKKLLIRSRRRGISAAPAVPKHGNNPPGIIVDVAVVIFSVPVEPVIVAFSTVYAGTRVKRRPEIDERTKRRDVLRLKY